MKRVRKPLIFIVLILFVFLVATLGYVKLALPDVGGVTDLKITLTPARVERGKYLANHVSSCIDCHSKRDWEKFAGPTTTSTIGAGGEKFDHTIGFPGIVYSPNITPYHLKDWTDGELFRLITTGVTKNNKAIVNIMPYHNYGKMDKEDIYAIIAYIRTLPSKATHTPERQLDFPLSLLVNTIPKKAEFQTLPPTTDTLKYGAYLVNAAACVDCHTKQDKGSNIEGLEFAGGRDFIMPTGTVYSSNITPDPSTGIGNWTKEQFMERFKHYDPKNPSVQVKKGQFQSVMPWIMY
uniref:c-type cytochrome n=1 Tax=Pedobacter sp. TaxID=1411316 RepID=UPI003D7F8E78